jgi:hypothetical protein
VGNVSINAESSGYISNIFCENISLFTVSVFSVAVNRIAFLSPQVMNSFMSAVFPMHRLPYMTAKVKSSLS